MSQFAAPASAQGIDWSSLKNSLLIVEVAEIVKGINTSFGTTDAVRATVTVVDGPLQGETYPDTLVFPKVLQSQLGPNVGRQVLGRLGQGQAKPGQSAPWTLTEATQTDQTAAASFLTQHAAQQLSADDI